LINILEKSRDKLNSEILNYDVELDHSKFYTEDGVRDRKDRLKLRALLIKSQPHVKAFMKDPERD
jgi:hypothetical protein